MSPTVRRSRDHDVGGVDDRAARMRALISFVMCGITWRWRRETRPRAPSAARNPRLRRRYGSRLGEVLVDEALVVPDVEVGLGAVLGDEDLAVLERAHRPRVDVQVRVELLRLHPQAARLQEAPSDAATIPLPSHTTPPVTKTYFVGRVASSRARPADLSPRENGRRARSAPRDVRSPRTVRPARARSLPIGLSRDASRNSPSMAPSAFDPASPSIAISRYPEGAGRRRRPGVRERRGREVRLQRPTGARVELVQNFAASPTSSAPEIAPCCDQADRGDADQLEDARRPAAREMRAKAALRTAPEIIDQADRGNAATAGPFASPSIHPTSGTRRPRKLTPSGPQAPTLSASCRRGGRTRDVATRCAMIELQLDLSPRNRERAASIVTRTSHRTRPQRGNTPPAPAGECARCPESGSRNLDAPEYVDEAPADPLREPEAAPYPRGNAATARSASVSAAARARRRDRHHSGARARARPAPLPTSGLALATRAAGRRRARLPLSRPCGRGNRRPPRSPPRPGVLAPRLDRRPDPRLVARGDEDRERLIHPSSQGKGKMAGSREPARSSWFRRLPGQQRIGEQGDECELSACVSTVDDTRDAERKARTRRPARRSAVDLEATEPRRPRRLPPAGHCSFASRRRVDDALTILVAARDEEVASGRR